jgi:capsular polysaccharide export protein
MLTEFCNKHVLLLQGPLGPFFYYLYKDLKENGAKVTKFNFCGGDDFFFFNKDTVKYKDSLENWPEYLKKFILEKKIDAIMLLGDCRPYHAVAKKITQELEIDFYSFEEGYLRPDFITLEKDGVNGYSKTPQDPAFFLSKKFKPLSDIEPVGKVFGGFSLVCHSILYCHDYQKASLSQVRSSQAFFWT